MLFFISSFLNLGASSFVETVNEFEDKLYRAGKSFSKESQESQILHDVVRIKGLRCGKTVSSFLTNVGGTVMVKLSYRIRVCEDEFVATHSSLHDESQERQILHEVFRKKILSLWKDRRNDSVKCRWHGDGRTKLP
jgi:hypothetical protein